MGHEIWLVAKIQLYFVDFYVLEFAAKEPQNADFLLLDKNRAGCATIFLHCNKR